MDEPRTPHDQPPLSAPAFQQPVAVSSSPDEAGHIMGIIGLVLAFTGLQLIGLILSIVGYVRSKRVGIQNVPALIGIILNGLIVFIGTVAIVFFIFLLVNHRDSLSSGLTLQQPPAVNASSPEKTIAGAKAAQEIVKRSELYHAKNGIYPLMLNDFEHDSSTSLKQLRRTVISSQPLTASNAYKLTTGSPSAVISRLEVYACGTTEGNKIGYWDTATNEVVYTYSGLAGVNSTCAIMK